MNPDLFRRVGVLLYGDDWAWGLSQKTGLSADTVRRIGFGVAPMPPSMRATLINHIAARRSELSALLAELEHSGQSQKTTTQSIATGAA